MQPDMTQGPTILLNGGGFFEGTVEQFRDCFFDNATIESIREWAEERGLRFEIREEEQE